MESDLERGNGARRINRRSGDRAGAGSGAGAGGGRRAQSRGQGWMTMLTLHAVCLAANGLLYMLIQIKYQNQRNSPFETHPVVMTSSLVAFFVYLCATVLQVMLVQTNNKLHDSKLLYRVLCCSGILSLLSNALVVLVTHEVGCIVVAIVAFAASIRLAKDLFMIISNYISERNNNNATTTSESLAMEMSTGTNNHVNNPATTSECMENSIAVNNNNNNNNNTNNNNDTNNNMS